MNKIRSLKGRGVFIAAPFLLLVIVLLTSAGTAEKEVVVIQNQRTGEVYGEEEAVAGMKLTVSWIHSVEKTKWQDTILVNDEGELILAETRFQSYGAGVDHESKEDVVLEDGNIVYKNLNKKLACYQWIHSHEAEHTVTINDNRQLSKEIPHHEAVEICVESR
ncbi:DUF1850 domain-containing protein [Bacillus piscicola]|uniref:DUF1850 domain-containing protein n=1 Tax=Bacillus piscicola TaxID=1632684 RepID=UPI001F094182|nr:DUF1850 domain-containing protein [Bacillus piscicola]